ncbi:MAG: flagellar biosynthesis protein FlhB [Candidatus Lambdaproteobacteria bacterium]|nr:flagellar biosynthesis protein FlhB [Candidatus Lambdaproteobacteria bacterium]
MAEAGAQERTEAPSQKRREDARKEGMVAVSREFYSAALLGALTLYFMLLGERSLVQVGRVWSVGFQQFAGSDLTVDGLYRLFMGLLLVIALPMAGVLGVAMIVALLAGLLQVGPLIVPFTFKTERLDPIRNLQRLFSLQGLADLVKSVFKMGVIGAITYLTFSEHLLAMLSLASLTVEGILAFNFSMLAALFGRVALAMVALAVFDYLFQRWQLEQRLKMTRQEMREELRQTEGDPQIRARVRQVQREMSNARMMQKVPKADVVVTNPTHYAVALIYDREAMTAPQVAAKGADFLAQRIRQIAGENDVPIVENAPVARQLYDNVEIGQEIPEEFFRAVAEILAYVYRLKGKTVAPPA